MRYSYNIANMPKDNVVSEDKHTIKYEPTEEQKQEFNKEKLSKISCVITGKDILSKNKNFIYSKIINRIEEMYDNQTMLAVDKYHKKLVKSEIKNGMLKMKVSKSLLKNEDYKIFYNIENLMKRIIEVEQKEVEKDI